MTDVNAEIIAIGTEILLGELTDTNSVHIARQLRDIGVNLFFMTSVGDNRQRIADAVRIALGRADVIITCGGLGPTVDDVTRHGVADAVGQELEFHEELYEQIAARFAMYKVTMTENNRQQAFVPAGAIAIPNPVGTAPSFRVDQDHKHIFSLPGVPREMKYLLAQAVVPFLVERYGLRTIRARILKTAGIGESALDELLGSALLNQANPTVGLAAHHGVIDIRITAKADTPENADQLIDVTQALVLERAGKYIFGGADDELEAVFVTLMRQHGGKLAIFEAGIETTMVRELQQLPDVDAIIPHIEAVSHPDEILREGEVYREAAERMARHLVNEHGVDASIVMLSLPDVDENADVEIATVASVCVGDHVRTRTYGFGGQSDLARNWVSRWSLAYAWRHLREQFEHVD